jgi:hypothetical protein
MAKAILSAGGTISVVTAASSGAGINPTVSCQSLFPETENQDPS